MNSEGPLESTPSTRKVTPQATQDTEAPTDRALSGQASGHPATVIVRGETVRDQRSDGASDEPGDDQGRHSDKPRDSKAKEERSETKLGMRDRLPALDDDAMVGVEKEQLVSRDEKADLTFTGTLIASAAPGYVTEDYWDEYRIYETNGGKHVFSKVKRNVFAGKLDRHEAEVYDPAPASVPSQLLRSARDLTRSHPMTWKDAAVSFFGYDPLAKKLYRKLGDQFNEHIS
jgi:hypothetical protein